MAETWLAAAAAAGQAQFEAILSALHDLQTQQTDSSAQLRAQLQLQQVRFDTLEQNAAIVADDETGADNMCMNPTCAKLHGSRKEKCVEGDCTHDFCGLTCASAALQANTRPAGPQPFLGKGASVTSLPSPGDFQYPLGEDIRDALARKPGQLTQNTSLVRLQMQLQDINYHIQEHVPLAEQQAHPEIYASLVDLEGKFNTHIDAFVVAPCVMQVDDRAAAASFNQGDGANLFSTSQGTELFQSWAKRSFENVQKQATDPSHPRGGGLHRGGRQRGSRGGQNESKPHGRTTTGQDSLDQPNRTGAYFRTGHRTVPGRISTRPDWPDRTARVGVQRSVNSTGFEAFCAS